MEYTVKVSLVPAHCGLKIDGLLVPPVKPYTRLTDHLITGLSLPRKSGSSQTIHTYKPFWFTWMVIFVGCYFVIFVGCYLLDVMTS